MKAGANDSLEDSAGQTALQYLNSLAGAPSTLPESYSPNPAAGIDHHSIESAKQALSAALRREDQLRIWQMLTVRAHDREQASLQRALQTAERQAQRAMDQAAQVSTALAGLRRRVRFVPACGPETSVAEGCILWMV